jgi:pimeloyl-ACP methyl ester carboxylesterase
MSVAPNERPCFFDSGGHTLLGILTEPIGEATGTVVLLASGGGTPSTSTERDRMFVRLARALADSGHHVFRFDWHGVGDSTGEVLTFRLDQPFLEDLAAAITFLRSSGLGRFVIVGSCFGARTTMAAHATIEGVRAVVLIAPPVRDFALSERRTLGWRLHDYVTAVVKPRRLIGGDDRITARRYLRFLKSGGRVILRRVTSGLRRQTDEPTWVSGAFVHGLTSLVERDLPTLLLYGTEDEEFLDFEEFRAGRVGRLVDRAKRSLEINILPGRVHGFTRIDSQVVTVEAISDWIGRLVSDEAAERDSKETREGTSQATGSSSTPR